ncbi:MAG TPA: S8 family serine peptidase [Pyrinomonadaceae bacterium]|nr:S8 family serine peptidase [Pyrinomonadaceae bacterium]
MTIQHNVETETIKQAAYRAFTLPQSVLRILMLFAALNCLIVSDVLRPRAASSKTFEKPAASPQSFVSDFSLSNLQVYGDYIYWIDRKDGGIYRAKTPSPGSSRSQASAALGQPEKLWSGLPLASPVGLAVDSSGVVYVLDDQLKAVFSLTSPAPKLLYSGSALVKPTALAAAQGRLFLIDSGTSKLYSLDAARGELTSEYEFKEETPDRLLADGTDLITYHFGTNVLLHFSIEKEVTAARLQEGEQPSLSKLTSGRKLSLTRVLSSVVDLSLRNGIVYFIDRQSGKFTLLALEGREPSYVPLTMVSDNPLALVASPDSVFFLEGNPIRIRRQRSLQPVTLNFVGEWTSKNIVDFYSYLFSRQLLPQRTVSVANLTTLKDLVNELKLLPTGYIDNFQLLFCELNESNCSAEQRKVPLAGGPTPEGFAVKLSPGQSINVPDLPVTPYITRRNLRLPLDPKIYKPEFFAYLTNASLEQVATELGPKTLSPDGLREMLKSYNTDYVGKNILIETKGFFSIPLQGARVTAVVPRSDLLDPNSLVRRLAEKKNISGTSPMFQMRKEAISNHEVATLAIPRGAQSASEPCGPSDPAIRSAAMDLMNYCEPVFSSTPQVGIIDYGFNPRHPAFALPDGGSALEVFNQSNQPVDSDPIDIDPARTTYKDIDHGTHMAAIIGARAQPREMVGLLPTAMLFGVPLNSLTEALEQWEFLRIFNVSLGETGAVGGPLSGADELDTVFSTYRLKLFVLSAGNEAKIIPKNALAAQGVMDNVIVVGATNVPEMDSNHERPSRSVLMLPNGQGSNRHPFFVGLMAPGEKIKSALVNGQYGVADGTSEAAAFVSAGAAALMALEPRWAAWQVKSRLIATANLWTGTPLSEAVLAGEFNFKRALADRDAVVIQRQTEPGLCRGDIDSVSLAQTMVVKQGIKVSRIPWNQVLRVKRDQQTGTEYTIIYYVMNELPDRDNRQLLRLTKVTTEQLRENDRFIFIPRDPSNCKSGAVSVFDLLDFINKGPFVTGSN